MCGRRGHTASVDQVEDDWDNDERQHRPDVRLFASISAAHKQLYTAAHTTTHSKQVNLAYIIVRSKA